MKDTPAQNTNTAPAPAPKKSHKVAIIVIIYLVVTITIGVVIGIVFRQTIVDFFYSLDFEPTEEMSQTISNVGLTSKADFILRSTRPSFEQADAFNEYCPSENEDTSTLGCYSSYDNRIYVYDIEDGELDGVKESILAHELLHAIYDRIGITKIDAINQAIDSYYKEHKDIFGNYMDSYTDDMYYTELHSIIGQRVHYADLSPALQEHYSQYFVDYDKMVGYYDQYHSKLEEIDNEVAAMSNEIDELRSNIENRRVTYESELERFNNDVDYHNRQTNLGYWNQSRYNSLIARSKQLDIDRENLNADIDIYNEKVRVYNELLDSRSHLYGLLDSKYSKKTEETTPAGVTIE